ncbi:MAG: RluA family pseudouridine synthase [Verrucomicrobiae bacterium]|nr:RluA family pseudouridine synthase [Verrucomicrobiae bacterium]
MSTRTLLEWLLAKYPQTPRTRAKQWIVAGRVSVNGVVMRRPHQLIADPGDRLVLLKRDAASLDWRPDGFAIHERLVLLYVDRCLAVLNKDAGLLCVGAPSGEPSALDILAAKLPTLPPAYRRLRPLPVHRLDRDTSGVFCVAMNPSARLDLIEQVRSHKMRREYVGFVEGTPCRRKGAWRAWLKLDEDEREQAVVPPGTAGAAESVTHYEVLEVFPRAGVSKLRLWLETGLRHQIRVQAAEAGLPLVGDRRYNPGYRGPLRRQALHAVRLTLRHPLRKCLMTFEAPLPEDLREFETRLKKEATVDLRR